jgi:hypothetical protein
MKECINQPFNPYQDKILLLIEGLENSLKEAAYVGFTSNQNHRKQHVVGYHFFKTQIGGKTAYFNIQMTVQNQFFLYSITESIRWKLWNKKTPDVLRGDAIQCRFRCYANITKFPLIKILISNFNPLPNSLVKHD